MTEDHFVRSPRWLPQHGIARRAATTLLTAAIVFAITHAASIDTNWSLVLGTFVGGVTLVVQVLSQLEGRVDELDSALSVGFTRVSRATELFGQIESGPAHRELVFELAQYATRLGVDTPPLVTRLIGDELQRTSKMLKGIGEGTVRYEGEDRDWLLTLASRAERSIDAISLTTVDDRGTAFESNFWHSDLGRRYLRVQRDQVQHNVRIRRLFVIDGPTRVRHWPDFLALCRVQEEMGIEVRILETVELEELFDFVVFDEAVAYETIPAYAAGRGMIPGIWRTELQVHLDLARKRVEQHASLWNMGQRLENLRPDAGKPGYGDYGAG